MSNINNTGDVSKITNMAGSGGEKGNSLADVKAQEIKKIGLPPIQEKLNKSPLEQSEDEGIDQLLNVNDSRALTMDANAPAMKLTNLQGFPE